MRAISWLCWCLLVATLTACGAVPPSATPAQAPVARPDEPPCSAVTSGLRLHRLMGFRGLYGPVCALGAAGGITCWEGSYHLPKVWHPERTFRTFSGDCAEPSAQGAGLLCSHDWEPAVLEQATTAGTLSADNGTFGFEDGRIDWTYFYGRQQHTRTLATLQEAPRRIDEWCALGESGAVFCWGASPDGASARVPAADCTAWRGEEPKDFDNEVWDAYKARVPASCNPPAQRVEGLGQVLDLAGSARHTCSLNSAGRVLCWGLGSRLGVADVGERVMATPIEVAGLRDVVELTATYDGTCALTREGTTFCWGDAPPFTREPQAMKALPKARAIALSGLGTCVLTEQDTIACVRDDGLLVEPTVAAELTLGRPVLVREHDCILLEDGTVRCWGDDSDGSVSGRPTRRLVPPQPVAGVTRAVDLVRADEGSCALRDDGALVCWGTSRRDASGRGDAGLRTVARDVTRVVSHEGRMCIVKGPASTLHCTGTLSQGELLDTVEFTGLHEPLRIDERPLARVVDVVLGPSHLCASDEDGAVYCMGDNHSGQLGQGDGLAHTGLVRVSGLPPVHGLFLHDEQTCGLSQDEQAFCWGRSEDFRPVPSALLCGSGPLVARTMPVFEDEGKLVTSTELGLEEVVFGAWEDRPVLEVGPAGVAPAPDATFRLVASSADALCLQDEAANVTRCWTRTPRVVAPSHCPARWPSPTPHRNDGTPPYPLRPFRQLRLYKYSDDAVDRSLQCEDAAVSVANGAHCEGDLRARGVALSSAETRSVVDALNATATRRQGLMHCYEPRHELVFLDERGDVVARMSFCLACSGVDGTPAVPRDAQSYLDGRRVFPLLAALCRKYRMGACG